MRLRPTLFLAVLASLTLAFLLGTAGLSSVSDAVPEGPSPLKHTVSSRPRSASPASADAPNTATLRPRPERPIELPAVAVTVELRADLSSAIQPASSLMPTWDPEHAWPLPDDLPNDPVVNALQEVLSISADTQTQDYAQALDILELTLLEGPAPSDPWTHLARIEAERQLVRADYHDDLLDHDQQLIEWSEAGGVGPRPEPPSAWPGDELAEDALDLALLIDAFDEAPGAAHIARLTAASVLLDWESEEINEDVAVEAIFDAIYRAESSAALATATDLLVGTRTELDADQLSELHDLLDLIAGPSSTRLAWFLASRQLAHGSPEDALTALDHGIATEAMSEDRTSNTFEARASLEAGRGALLGIAGQLGGRSLAESVQAAAWKCWRELLQSDSSWTRDGTSYRAHAIVTSSGTQWVDWTDDNTHGHCLADASSTFVLPDTPVQLWIDIEPTIPTP